MLVQAVKRNQPAQVFDARRELMLPPNPPKQPKQPKQPIGFINPEDKSTRKTSGANGKT